ncbi:MAG: SH3 domain-containing protein [Rhizobiaceae bacterium]|nr:SH3 domain-containing protein [Rhizobiaceae bacterium]
MKGLFKAPKSRRVSYEFRHGARASIWHEISVRSHLVVAAIGTVVFLGMAGTAIWLALPSNRTAVLAARNDPVKPAPEAAIASLVAAPQKAATASRAPVKNAEELRAQTAGSEPDKARVAADPVKTLGQTDQRWVDSNGKDVKAALSAAAGAATEDALDDIVANAYADDGGGADAALTAAIPAKRPDAPKAAEVADEEPSKQTADATRQSRTLRAVTLRSRPSSRGSVLGTVPGRATVDVISCSSWCEIVYSGKHGYVYKGFLRNGGR